MYLVVGGKSDTQCRRIGRRLRELKLPYAIRADPFDGAQEYPDGVVVPWPRAARTPAERSAALLGWVWTLDCPVVNRLPAHLWFRPARSPLEWRPALERHGIRTVACVLTNDMLAARDFGERWGGHATYWPITSRVRYPIHGETDWSELAKLMVYIPVCLVQPVAERFYACAVNNAVIWSAHARGQAGWRNECAPALRNFKHALELDVMEFEFGRSDDGPVCTAISLFPDLERYGPNGDAIVDGIVARLRGRP